MANMYKYNAHMNIYTNIITINNNKDILTAFAGELSNLQIYSNITLEYYITKYLLNNNFPPC